MIKLVCPKCGGEARLSLADGSYSGPRRCWKCHEYFTITIINNRITSCEPLSDEEYERLTASKKGPEKGRGDIETSRREEPDIPRLVPERNRDYSKPFNFGKSSDRPEPVRQESMFPPDEVRAFVSGEDKHKAPEKPPAPGKSPDKRPEYISPSFSQGSAAKSEPGKTGSVYPPDRFRTFVPLEEDFEESEKPKKPKDPPDRFNLFIPPAA